MPHDPRRRRPPCDPPRDLVRPVRADPRGRTGPTPNAARGPRWRRTTRGYYVPASVDGTRPEQRILEQSMRLPPGGAVTGWAACRMAGAGFFDGLEPDGVTPLAVPLATGPRGQLRPAPGSLLTRERLLPQEVVVRHGVPCTRPGRALFDAMRLAGDVREAVVALDMMAAAGLVSVSQLARYVVGRAGWTKVGQVRAALPLADEDSRSPNETRTRLVWQLDAGLARPLVNQPVWDLAGTLLGYADLLLPEPGVVGEYDGADHRRARRHSNDVRREHALRAAGLEYVAVTGPDLRDTGLLVQRLRATVARAAVNRVERRWTIDPPPGWSPPAPGLDAQLELRALLHGVSLADLDLEVFGRA